MQVAHPVPLGQAELENHILQQIVADYPEDALTLQEQLSKSRRDRDMTGVGFYLNFGIPENVSRLKTRRPWADGWFEADGLQSAGGYLLWVTKDGLLDALEGYCVEEWPRVKIGFRKFLNKNLGEQK